MKKPLALSYDPTERSRQLDELVLEIEFMLISIIQGVALVSLATGAATLVDRGPLVNLWYIAVGLLLILVFWSQSIVHALSFIRWPLDLAHNWLYFVATLIEVIIFGQVYDPAKWFGATTLFFVIAAILYWVDMRLIRQAKPNYLTASDQALYRHIEWEQRVGLYGFVPLGLVYNLAAWLIISAQPAVHWWFMAGELVIGALTLGYTLRRFRERARLLQS